jgi:thiol-disulfide isomerase/thioredoxin
MRRSPKDRLVALAGLVVIVGVSALILSAAGILGNQGGGEGIEDVQLLDVEAPPGLEVGTDPGNVALDFEISDFEGNRHRLSDFRGSAVYVNFWATWCIPCQIEMPHIQELLDQNEDDLVVITVNRREPLDRAVSFLDGLERMDGGRGVSFTVNGMDPDDTLYRSYRALGMPASVFIDPDGVITGFVNGLILLPQMEELLAEALNGAEQVRSR